MDNRPTFGEPWNYACDSYGKVRHSKKACVYTTIKGERGERIVSIAARIPNWADAKLIVAACNACQVINPANPQAVAEALPELVQALRDLYANVDRDLSGWWTESTANRMQQAEAAILKMLAA